MSKQTPHVIARLDLLRYLTEVWATARLNLLPIASDTFVTHSESEIPNRLLNLKQLIANVQSKIPNSVHPQRRVFSENSVLSTQSSVLPEHTNRYIALAAATADEDFDPDPIYTYDLNGNRISMIDPTGLTTYNCDELNRLTSITNNEALTTTFAYDALGRRTSMTHDNGVVTTYNYDAASQLLSLVHQLGAATINSFTYTYDKVGNRKTKADNSGVASYTYDTLNRLTEAVNPLPSNPLESFTYDEVGNRVDSNQNGTSTFNNANQLEGDTDSTYSYDNNGNLTQKTNKITSAFTLYEYDAENRLIRVVREDGSIVNYKYDGLGRRIEKEVDSVVTQYIFDREDILLELDGSNNIVARYTHGSAIDEPLIMEKGGQSFFYHADDLGSITELTDTLGTVAQSYTYSSFGKIEFQLDSNFIQPYTFTARELDPETGLYFYRARYYDPSLGRFLQEDPLGIANEVNFYTYASNDLVKFIDPFGEIRGRSKKFQRLSVSTPGGEVALNSTIDQINTALENAIKGNASKEHIGKLETLRKVKRKGERSLARSLGQTARKGGKKSVVGFIVFGLFDDLQLVLEAILCGRSIGEQFQKNVESLGNPEFLPVSGVIIPNPFFVPGRL